MIGDTCVLFFINILCSQHLLEEMIKKFKTVSLFIYFCFLFFVFFFLGGWWWFRFSSDYKLFVTFLDSLSRAKFDGNINVFLFIRGIPLCITLRRLLRLENPFQQDIDAFSEIVH